MTPLWLLPLLPLLLPLLLPQAMLKKSGMTVDVKGASNQYFRGARGGTCEFVGGCKRVPRLLARILYVSI